MQKKQLIQKALDKVGISGLTAPLSDDDFIKAFNTLQNMMYGFEAKGIVVNYNFGDAQLYRPNFENGILASNRDAFSYISIPPVHVTDFHFSADLYIDDVTETFDNNHWLLSKDVDNLPLITDTASNWYGIFFNSTDGLSASTSDGETRNYVSLTDDALISGWNHIDITIENVFPESDRIYFNQIGVGFDDQDKDRVKLRNVEIVQTNERHFWDLTRVAHVAPTDRQISDVGFNFDGTLTARGALADPLWVVDNDHLGNEIKLESQTNIAIWAVEPIIYQLAVQLASEFLVPLPDEVMRKATAGYSMLCSKTTPLFEKKYPNGFPKGRGNTFKQVYGNRYYIEGN